MFPVNRRFMWGLLWTWRQKWQLHSLMPAEPDSPAIPSEVCVPATKWLGLSLAREGWGFIFILHVLRSKDETSSIVMALLCSPAQAWAWSIFTSSGGARREEEALKNSRSPALPPAGEACFVIRAVRISLHSSFPSCVPMIGIWVWAEWSDGVSTDQLEPQSQNWSLCLNSLQ